MQGSDKHRRTWNARLPLMMSLAAVALLAAVLGPWAVRANIAGAVIGTGTVKVAQTMTAVQHPVGGVVREVLATNGDHVVAGDVILRLEDGQLRSDLAVVEDNLFEVLANIARLEAAIDGRRVLEVHPVLAEAAETREDISRLVDRQARQLAVFYDALATEARLLDEQVVQVNAQIGGLEAQVSARQEEMDLIAEENERLQILAGRGLLKQSELFNLRKTRASVSGEIGRLTAQIAELRGKISEIEQKRHTILPKERRIAAGELSKLRPERTKYMEQRASLTDTLNRLDIRAPISGRIHDTRVQGLQSVVVAAQPLMMIVPDDLPAFVSVRIRDTDIDQVHVGQSASLKFQAFDGRNIPIILARVDRVSADVFRDETTRKTYYDVTLAFVEEEIAKLEGRELIPGMPVDAFLSTESRTPLNYLLRPILVYFDRAFRDV